MHVSGTNLIARPIGTGLIGRLAGLQVRRQPGQVVVYSALLLTVLMGLAGAGVDYGLIVIESAKLQNALDAAALAGARALVTSTGSTQNARNTAAETAAGNFLALQNYTSGVNGATFTYSESASDGGAYNDTMTIVGTVAKPTSFWKIIGINTTNLNQRATAAAGAGMVDVMLSLDLSGSMELSGTDDLGNLQDAVVAFINQMQVTSGDPRGTQLGIARWAGIKCQWARGYTGRPGGNGTSPQNADTDAYIDLDHGPEQNLSLNGSTNWSEYVSPCTDDATVITPLSQDKAMLTKVADGSGGGTCPSGMSAYACPLASWRYTSPPVKATWGTPTPVLGLQVGNSSSSWYQMTGTKLSNALNVVNTGGYYAWSSANGGRNNAMTSEGLARKVLVVMTDGFSESGDYGIPTSAGTPGSWDSNAVTLATALKKGPDGDITTTADNVEIYVVGFYCVPYATGGNGWCASTYADTTQTGSPHPCPGGVYPAAGDTPSAVDNLLQSISSSTAGTCDHYFPIAKNESLPQLFRVMAGSIARGHLQ